MNILLPVLSLSLLGLIFGIVLAWAAKRFCVRRDKKTEQVLDKLPGANCGACGMPGCMGFAEGLIKGACTPDGCVVAKDEAREEISRILGLEHKKKEKRTATLHCNGGKRVKDRFLYPGIEDCVAANIVSGGQKECVWGCLGFGTCARACPFGAIEMGEDALPRVDESKCTACGKCVKACPKNLFTLIAASQPIYVACSSHDAAKATRDACSVGCIACRKCEFASAVKGAVAIENNLSVFYYNRSSDFEATVPVCPMHTIRDKRRPGYPKDEETYKK